MPEPKPATRTVADIDHVLEVALAGAADAAAWEPLLLKRGLRPAARDGAVELELMATDLRWKGIRFREWSVAVPALPLGATEDGGALGGYLPQAFNSAAPLAWAERVLFKTPYRHAVIAASGEPPAAMAVTLGGRAALRARMAGPRAPSETRQRDLASVVYLPGEPKRQFDVRLAGEQMIYPVADDDEWSLAPIDGYPIFAWLRDSQFAPSEWRICRRARHRKSNTYRQPGA
ncbi:MAG TPA: hypothetical protein VGE07_21525 [Herpetosiphonaceae bacterium]